MKKYIGIFAILIACNSWAGVANMIVPISKVQINSEIDLDCIGGVMYSSEGGNSNGGWALTTAVCRSGGGLLNASWIIHVDDVANDTSPHTFKSGKNTKIIMGKNCVYGSEGWKCKSVNKNIRRATVYFDEADKKFDDEAWDWLKVNMK